MQEARFRVGGETLVGDHHAPDASAGARPARGALVLVHGFNSCRREFGPLPALLAQAGYHALAFDQRGYGASEGERGRTGVERAVQDIGAAAAWLQGRAPRLPLGVVGHSLGGAYALAALGRIDLLRAGVAAHPVDRLFDELKPVKRLGYHVLGLLAERRMRRGRPPGSVPYELAYEELYVSREAAEAARRDGYLLGRVSLANYRPALEVAGAAWARQVRQPVLVVASPHDRAVRPAHSRAVHDALAGPKAWLEHRGGHSCFRDLDGAMVAHATAGWFDRHLGGA